MTALNPTRGLILSAIAAGGALGLAFIAQYGFGLYPCQLCYVQRLPYAGILALALLSLLPAVDEPSRRLAVTLCGLLFLVLAGAGFYHVGVEQQWWVSTCSPAESLENLDLAAAVSRPALPSCTDIQFKFAGISMAGYNVIAGLILGIATLLIARRSTP